VGKITKFSMARVGIEELIFKPEKENQKKKIFFGGLMAKIKV